LNLDAHCHSERAVTISVSLGAIVSAGDAVDVW
jgi:hypothetical protein